MSDKPKNTKLSAFLQKQKTRQTTKNVAAPPKEDATVALGEETKAKVDEVAQKAQTQIDKNKANANSSDEEEEVDELANGLDKEFKEKKDVTSAKQQDEKLKAGYGFENETQQIPDGPKDPKPKKATDKIVFGSKPTFKTRSKAGLGGGFEDRLDDIDDDGTTKKRNKDYNKGGEGSANADASREFINLGASARQGGDRKDPEEEKTAERKPGVRPTFRGKANLTGTGGNKGEENVGVVTNYSYSVALKGPAAEKGQHEEGKEAEGHVRKDGRKNRDKGQPFSTAAKPNDGEDEDGFEVVQGKDRKRRGQKPKQQNSDSDSDDGYTVTKGGFRGGRGGGRGGRGGFFKNSKRDGAGPAKEEGF